MVPQRYLMRMGNELFTIGFAGKTAESFFNRLTQAKVKQVVDVRLHNVSQLSGFAKRDDLKYFLREIAEIDYLHVPALAPTEEMLQEYRKGKGNWELYARRFRDLLRERKIEDSISPELVKGGCLLCSEDKPHHCHRRIVAEYLQQRWGSFEIVHL
jgi:uncharacterized protein (DUF488 family)